MASEIARRAQRGGNRGERRKERQTRETTEHDPKHKDKHVFCTSELGNNGRRLSAVTGFTQAYIRGVIQFSNM